MSSPRCHLRDSHSHTEERADVLHVMSIITVISTVPISIRYFQERSQEWWTHGFPVFTFIPQFRCFKQTNSMAWVMKFFLKCCIFAKIIVWKCFISILQVSQFWGESNQQSGGKVVDRAYCMCMVYFTSGYEVTRVLIMKTLSACDPAHCDSFFNSSTSPYFSRKSHIYHGSYFLTNEHIHANVNIINIVHSFDRMQLQ